MKPNKKSQILKVSAKLFRERGYAATSVRDIAREMLMEAPSLYNHISSKQEILVELLLTVANNFTQGMSDIRNAATSSIEKLEQIVALHVRETIKDPDAMSLVTSDWSQLEGENRTKYLELRSNYETNFRTILNGCIADGTIEPVNVDIATYSILSSLRYLYSWYSRHPNIDATELEKGMIQCLVTGLGKPKAQ